MRILSFLGLFTLAWAIVASLTIGCSSNTPRPTPEQIYIEKVNEILPENSTIVKDLGSKWYIIEMEVDGKKIKLLFNWWYGSHGEIGRSFTELKNE